MIPLSPKSIQKALNIPETGIYDDFTEAAVRNFQLRNTIDPSGIVDLATAKKLFPAEDIEDVEVIDEHIPDESSNVTTDLSETHIDFKVNIKYLPKTTKIVIEGKQKLLLNYLEPSEKQYLFLHHTAGWENPYGVIDQWANDSRGPIATQFVIGGRNCQTLTDKYDGDIVQCMEYDQYGWHLGIGGTVMHKNSIGIELCNFGFVTKVNGQYLSYINKRVANSEVVDLKKKWRGYQYYHRYTDRQLESLKLLIDKIGTDQGIDIRAGLQQRLKKMNKFDAFNFDPIIATGKLKGLFTHANVSGPNKYGGYEKWDLFPQDEVCDLILSL